MKKRIADLLEKISAGCLLVAAWQDKPAGYFVAALAFAICLEITRRSEKR